MLVSVAKAFIRVLPAPWAGRVIRAIASRTQRPQVRAPQQAALDHGSMLHYGKNGRNVAWSWGTGPLVIFVHGWNGRAAQMAPLAAGIAELGFRCVALDITGHGRSHGKRTDWRHFIDDIAALTTSLNLEVHAYVGHSAGGLAMMAARAIKSLRAHFYICVCAPSHPFPPIRSVQERLAPSQTLISGYKNHIAHQFDADWRQLESGKAFAKAGADLLLFYDEADRFVDHSEGERIQAWCPGASLIKSATHGHSRVLEAPELAQSIGRFLRP